MSTPRSASRSAFPGSRSRSAPILIFVFLSVVASTNAAYDFIAGGQAQTCALDTKYGNVKCWGYGHHRGLGYGDQENRYATGDSLPTLTFPTGTKPVSIDCGNYHGCAVLDDGNATCWGYGQVGSTPEWGVLGDDGMGMLGSSFSSAFKDVSGVARSVTDIASGYFYNCFALNDGAVKCISSNGGAYLKGEASFSGGRKAVKIDTSWGQSVCALLDDSAVVCWGEGSYGSLGQGTTYDISYASVSSTPDVDLGVEQRAKDICVGYMHSCALLESGSVKCWGNNYHGQLGFGSLPIPTAWVAGAPPPPLAPSPPPDGPAGYEMDKGDEPNEMGDALPAVNLGAGALASNISCGAYFTCALLENGSVKCWGNNWYGQLGYGHTDPIGHDVNEMGDNLPAVDLGAGRTATNVFLGSDHACATLDDGSIKCWGNGGSYQLGTSGNQNIGDGPGEMGDNLPTVDLGTFCGTDERVTSENTCASCAGGATNPAGDNPREYETTCACGVDEYVEQNHCTACPSGLGREGGDPVPGWGTICVESPTCRADERVSSRACVACPAGQTNDAGDATWGGDTACESPPAGADSTNATSESPAVATNGTSGTNETSTPDVDDTEERAPPPPPSSPPLTQPPPLILIPLDYESRAARLSSAAWNLPAACIALGFAASSNRYGAE